MTKRSLYFLVLVFLLLAVGIGFAQSSPNFVMHRFATVSGGTSDSANYAVRSAIGQPAAGSVSSTQQQVSAGFLFPVHQQRPYDLWLPVIRK